jgi:hypothetical protein
LNDTFTIKKEAVMRVILFAFNLRALEYLIAYNGLCFCGRILVWSFSFSKTSLPNQVYKTFIEAQMYVSYNCASSFADDLGMFNI